MAIPPCQGSVREGTCNKFNFAPFRTGVDLEDRIRFLKPLRKGNDSSSPVKGPRLVVGEVLIQALSRAHRSITLSGCIVVSLLLVPLVVI